MAVALAAAAAPAKAPAEPAPRRRGRRARLRGFDRVQQGSTGYAARAAPRGCGERRVSCQHTQPGGCRVRRGGLARGHAHAFEPKLAFERARGVRHPGGRARVARAASAAARAVLGRRGTRRDSAPALAFARDLEPKRRRVDRAPRGAEERSLAALRGTLRRAAEASGCCAWRRVGALCARRRAAVARGRRGSDPRRHDAASPGDDGEGARLASALVEALMGALVSAGDVERAERTAQKLRRCAPCSSAATSAASTARASPCRRRATRATLATRRRRAPRRRGARRAAGGARGGESIRNHGGARGRGLLPRARRAAALRGGGGAPPRAPGAAEAYDGDDVFEANRWPLPGASTPSTRRTDPRRRP